MKIHLEHKFRSVQQYTLLFIWSSVTFSYTCAKSVVEVSIYADGKPAWGRMGILTDSARKRNRKKVLANYNKTRINIVHQHDRWMVLNETLRVHQCHCTYSSEIWTCINIDAGRQVAHTKYMFFIEFRKTTFFTHVSKVYINFQWKKNSRRKLTN